MSPQLANGIQKCWQVGVEAATAVADPAAGMIAEYLPDSWLETVATSTEPIAAAVGLYLMVTQCLENEKRVVEAWHVYAMSAQQQASADNAAVGVSDAYVSAPDLSEQVTAEAVQ